MTIEVVPQPRIDHLVTGLDGATLRRTDHRGTVWLGGRQPPQPGGVLAMTLSTAKVETPFWLPDSSAYRTEAAASVVVTIAVGLHFVPEHCAIAEVAAALAVNDQHPEVSHVSVHLRGAARVPIGLSYQVTVLAPPDAVLDGA